MVVPAYRMKADLARTRHSRLQAILGPALRQLKPRPRSAMSTPRRLGSYLAERFSSWATTPRGSSRSVAGRQIPEAGLTRRRLQSGRLRALPSAHTRNYGRSANAKQYELSETTKDSRESATAGDRLIKMSWLRQPTRPRDASKTHVRAGCQPASQPLRIQHAPLRSGRACGGDRLERSAAGDSLGVPARAQGGPRSPAPLPILRLCQQRLRG
jgi:hypothetical protein